jgi:hypothetical protein
MSNNICIWDRAMFDELLNTDSPPSRNFRDYNGGNLTGSYAFEFKTNPVKSKDLYLPTTRHKQISEQLNDPRVLTIPEKYFGPNYKPLLNIGIVLVQFSVVITKILSKISVTLFGPKRTMRLEDLPKK